MIFFVVLSVVEAKRLMLFLAVGLHQGLSGLYRYPASHTSYIGSSILLSILSIPESIHQGVLRSTFTACKSNCSSHINEGNTTVSTAYLIII